MEIEGKDQQPFNVLAMFDRVHHPPPKDVPAERKVPRVGSAWFPARNSVSKANKPFPGETGSNWNYQAEADSEIPIPVNRNESRKISRMI